MLHPSLLHRLATDNSYQPKNLLRGYVAAFNGVSSAIPQADVLQQLVRDGFGVYQPNSVAKPAPVRAAAGVAAAIAVGIVAWLLRK